MPFEFGGQEWPDTTTVTEIFDITWQAGGDAEGMPIKTYKLCVNAGRSGGAYDPVCEPVTDVRVLSDGRLTGKVRILREQLTESPGWLRVRHGKEQPPLHAARQMTPEQLATYAEHVIVDSAPIPMPTARTWDVPESSLLVLLSVGILACVFFSKVRRRKSDTSPVPGVLTR